jgi:hypothetical protein
MDTVIPPAAAIGNTLARPTTAGPWTILRVWADGCTCSCNTVIRLSSAYDENKTSPLLLDKINIKKILEMFNKTNYLVLLMYLKL